MAQRIAAWVLVGCGLAAGPARGAEIDFEYFEKHVRPVLAEKCYACHGAGAANLFAGLRLDSRAGLLRGGDSGPAIVPQDSAGSLLLKALRGEAKTPMPPTGRLPEERIAAIAAWVDAGAPWPEENAPGLPDPSAAFDLEARRSAHWAWQPVQAVDAPGVDSFIAAKLREKGLQPAAAADRHTLLRRLAFAITGLPPTPEEVRKFVNDSSPDAYEKQVDRLLASPHYGERWARHWMDLFRYTESHGSEGDPDTLEAWRYRDYLIRALNADVPYDQLIREHVAGDLLPNPRIDAEKGINESIVATAHYRMIEHGFQPVDPWEDRVKWTDNQIDVFSKAFQGLTVSCARCHDHKFDAISQKDFYALFGIFKNARPTQRAIDAPAVLEKNRAELAALKQKIKDALAERWLAAADGVAKRCSRAIGRSLRCSNKPHAVRTTRCSPGSSWAAGTRRKSVRGGGASPRVGSASAPGASNSTKSNSRCSGTSRRSTRSGSGTAWAWAQRRRRPESFRSSPRAAASLKASMQRGRIPLCFRGVITAFCSRRDSRSRRTTSASASGAETSASCG